MDTDAGAGAGTPRRRRQREREEMLVGYELGPAITVSDENFKLCGTVFDMLDKDKNGRLESTDFVLAGTVDREVFHRACRPIPKAGIDMHEFLRRCARFACGEVLPTGHVRGQASRAPFSMNLQQYPIAKLLELAQERMNEELKLFFNQWKRSLEMTSGVAVAEVSIADPNMVMLCRVYNRLDLSYGDGDGMLSANDQCWPILQQNGYVASVSQTSITFEQFREAIVQRAITTIPFNLDRPNFTMDVAVIYVTTKLNEAILAVLLDMSSKLDACPSVMDRPMGSVPDLDRPPVGQESAMSNQALSLALDDTMLADLTLLYKDLDEDDSG